MTWCTYKAKQASNSSQPKGQKEGFKLLGKQEISFLRLNKPKGPDEAAIIVTNGELDRTFARLKNFDLRGVSREKI